MNRLLREWTADEVEDDEPLRDIVLQGTPREVEPCACGKVPNLDAWSKVVRREYSTATAEEIVAHHTPAHCIPWADHETKPEVEKPFGIPDCNGGTAECRVVSEDQCPAHGTWCPKWRKVMRPDAYKKAGVEP